MSSSVTADPRSKTRMLAVVGPTSTGKTAVALRIAGALGAEVVSADSVQVYRGMDIGTSKPTAAERERVRFHLVDVAEPGSDFSVARFKEMTDVAVGEILARGHAPLLVGGSGLYYRAVVDDLDFSNTGDTGLFRVEMLEELSDMSDLELHDLLSDLDPGAAREIAPSNRRRVLKAIEIARAGDRPVSVRQASWADFESPYDLRAAGLTMDRALLYQVIDDRVDSMVSAGLVEEVEALRRKGLRRGSACGNSLGYRQILSCLEGELTLDEAVEQIKTRTRNFAKRQMTWFRKDPRIRWFQVQGARGDPLMRIERSLDRAASLVLEYLS